MQEIVPLGAAGLLSSPTVLGELSRRLPSEFEVQNLMPDRNGLVGVSSGPVLRSLVIGSGGFRNISITLPVSVTTTMAFRSLASTQMLPAASRAMPSAPSIAGWATKTFWRQSVLGVNVVSQPVLLATAPLLVKRTFQIAPRAVSATRRLPSLSNATPFATSGCDPAVFVAVRGVAASKSIVPGGKVRASRPTPPTALASMLTSFAIGCTRNISVTVVPKEFIFHTRPCPVVPSPVQRLPLRSKASPLVPGTPEAKTLAVGGVLLLGKNL